MTSAWYPRQEPYAKRTSHGMILGENGEKMSKSRGNVVNPDDIVNEYGADTMRLYEMFIGDFEKAAPWSTAGIKGCTPLSGPLLEPAGYRCGRTTASGAKLESSFHKTIKKVTMDIENLKFNTAIAALMALTQRHCCGRGRITRERAAHLHAAAEPVCTARHRGGLGRHERVRAAWFAEQNWPSYDEAKCKDDTGRDRRAGQRQGARAPRRFRPNISKDDAVAAGQGGAEDRRARLPARTIVKEIYVPGKLVNIVAKG